MYWINTDAAGLDLTCFDLLPGNCALVMLHGSGGMAKLVVATGGKAVCSPGNIMVLLPLLPYWWGVAGTSTAMPLFKVTLSPATIRPMATHTHTLNSSWYFVYIEEITFSKSKQMYFLCNGPVLL